MADFLGFALINEYIVIVYYLCSIDNQTVTTMIKFSEYVSLGHPDKVADYISQYLLDRYYDKIIYLDSLKH